MTDTNITAWRVAAAIARETIKGVDNWGRWERSKFPDPNCDACWGRGGERDGDVPDQWYPCECLRPVPDPSDGAAYLADCARRGVEPGPLPSLSWTSDDKHTAWRVTSADVFLSIGATTVVVRLGGPLAGRVRITSDKWTATAADLEQLSALVTAAASALEHDHG